MTTTQDRFRIIFGDMLFLLKKHGYGHDFQESLLRFVESEKSLAVAEERRKLKEEIERLWQHLPMGELSEMVSDGNLISRKEVLALLQSNEKEK